MEMEVRDLLGLVRVVRDPDGDDVLVGKQLDEIGPQRLGQGAVQSARAMDTRCRMPPERRAGGR